MKILLIEDDIILSLNYQMMIEELGHDLVKVCRSIEEGRQFLQSQTVDVIVTDIMLGDEMAFVLSEWFKVIPTVFMTSFLEETLQVQAMKFPDAMFLAKPFHKLTLKSVLDKIATQIQITIPNSYTEGGIEVLTKHRQRKIIPQSMILWLEATGNYTTIVTDDKRYTLKISLKKISDILIPDFTQVHKGFIINVKYINRLDFSQNIVNIKGNQIPVGRSFKKNLLEVYNKVKDNQ